LINTHKGGNFGKGVGLGLGGGCGKNPTSGEKGKKPLEKHPMIGVKKRQGEMFRSVFSKPMAGQREKTSDERQEAKMTFRKKRL